MPTLDVMLSCTSRDLAEHRKRAEDACNRADFHANTMDYLPGRTDADAIDVSMDLVEKSEVYLGIFGMRYGYRPKDERNPNDISITEMEYRRAKELGMPILIFIMDEENHPPPDTTGMSLKDMRKAQEEFFESDPRGVEKLELLKKELLNNHIVDFFESAEDLRTKVLQALYQPSVREQAQAYYEEQQARLKADGTGDDPKTPQSDIPYPPEMYAYPPYSGGGAMFVGRHKELRILNDWSAPESEHPMLVFEAIGGMGKSALTWKWVQDRAVPFDGVFWYSFYEGGAEMGAFVRHALAYVRREPTDTYKGKSVQVLLPQLITALQNGRYLIVLDGLERVLVAYHRWNAAQMQDDEVQEGKDYRDCTNPRDTDVLKQLANCDPSRILITSRLMPNALKDGNDPLATVKLVELKGLSRKDAQRLWQNHGITWDDDGVMDGFIQQFGRHSLLLKLLVDIIKKNRRSNGNFSVWHNLYGADFDAFKDVKTKRHHILKFAYEGLTPEQQKLLSQMAALGNAIAINTLNVFNPYMNMPDILPEPQNPEENYMWDFWVDARKAEAKAKYAEKQQTYEDALQAKADYEKSGEYKHAIHQFDAMLQDLEGRGLIWWDSRNYQYDLHPVVRGYAFSQLSEDDKPVTFDTIYEYFSEQESTYRDQFESYAEMTNIIAMYNALIGAGKYDEAANLFWNRLGRSLVVEGLGLYHKAYELLLPLFPNGLSELPIVATQSRQSNILNLMGGVLSYSGRHQENLLVTANKVIVDLNIANNSNLRVSLNNYGIALVHNNQLAQALIAYQLAYDLAQLLDNKTQIAYSEYYLLGINRYLGRWEQAEEAYDAFIQHLPDKYWEISGHVASAETLMRQDANRSEIETILEDCVQLNQQVKNVRYRRGITQVYGDLMLREGDYIQAIEYYSEAARIGNEQGVRNWEEWSGLARAYALSGDIKKALQIVEDGVDDHGWATAVVHMKAGNIEEAKEAALEFYTWAWAQGEPYVWRWHLGQARDILKELGVDEPQLPVWDESQYEPFAHEAEIRELIAKLQAEKDAEDDETG